MRLKDVITLLKSATEQNIQIRLSEHKTVPANFHITEVGKVTKEFVDCGGVKRTESNCVLQVWVAGDIEHRLSAQKLLGILEKGAEFIDKDLQIRFEIEEGVLGIYELFGVNFTKSLVIFEVGKVRAACLAPDKCGVAPEQMSCSGKGCC